LGRYNFHRNSNGTPRRSHCRTATAPLTFNDIAVSPTSLLCLVCESHAGRVAQQMIKNKHDGPHHPTPHMCYSHFGTLTSQPMMCYRLFSITSSSDDRPRMVSARHGTSCLSLTVVLSSFVMYVMIQGAFFSGCQTDGCSISRHSLHSFSFSLDCTE